MGDPFIPLWSRSIHIDWPRIRSWIIQHREPLIVGTGIFLRVLVYLQGRAYWMDEGALLVNLTDHETFDFSEPFDRDQLAPFGFIVIERAIIHLLGDSVYATRLLPLICGIAALLLYKRLSHRILSPDFAMIAVALLALSDDLIYYSSELKPYSLDLLVGVAVSVATANGLAQGFSRRSVITLTILAILAPWFSFPAAFVVAGCGSALLLKSLTAGPRREMLGTILIGCLWSLSFATSYVASRRMLVESTTMYVFWDFAFIPILSDPLDSTTWNRSAGILFETLVNPLNLIFPYLVFPASILAVLLLGLGSITLLWHSRLIGLMLVLPILFAVVASSLHRFPLHGRLMLELVPACYILLASALDRIHEVHSATQKRAYQLLVVALLTYPISSSIFHSLSFRDRDFNAHGDLHENLFVK